VIIIRHIGVIDVTTDVIDVIVRFGSSLPPHRRSEGGATCIPPHSNGEVPA
jgi:hypothetical protein